jgi:hypothetical protein
LCYICGRHVLGLILGFEGSAAPAWLRGLGLRGVIFVLVIVVIRALMDDGAGGWFHNVFVAMVCVAAVAQQCIEEGVNLKVWVETRVYFKILS